MLPRKTRSNNWKKERKLEQRELIEKKYYIFCEGTRTEPLYFEGFKRSIEKNSVYKNLVHVQVEGVGADTERVINYAINYVKDNKIREAEIWCVYDKDSFPAETFNKVQDIANTLNKEQEKIKYNVAWSNQCVEYWFILHFNYYDVDNDRQYYIDNLNKNFKKKGLPNYNKSKDRFLFEKLTMYGNPKLAIRYAESRIRECSGKTDSASAPATKVYKLVEELAKYLPEDIIDKYV